MGSAYCTLLSDDVKADGFFTLDLTYDEEAHLFKMPIHLGYHDDDLSEPYWCALDFSIPTVIVPSYLCEECSGKKFTPDLVRGGGEIDDETIEYPHKMTYWKYTEGGFTVREED
jgi:hypothetical protein